MSAQLDDLDGEFHAIKPARALAVVADPGPLAVPLTPEQVERLAEMHQRAKATAERGRSKATRRAYAHDLADFTAFCRRNANLDPLDANAMIVAAYVSELAANGSSGSTIGRRLAAISGAFRSAGWDKRDFPTRSSAVDDVLAGIRRDHAADPVRCKPKKKAPVRLEALVAMVRPLGDSTADLRDRALLLFAFWSAMRRSEIAGLSLADVTFTREGVSVFLAHSKTDQKYIGRTIDIPRRASPDECPVDALRAWIDRAGSAPSAPLFLPVRGDRIGTERLNGQAVARIVKRHVERAGLDPALYGGHSTRSGFITECDAADVPNRRIKLVTGHKSDSVLDSYKQHRPDWMDAPSRFIKAVS